AVAPAPPPTRPAPAPAPARPATTQPTTPRPTAAGSWPTTCAQLITCYADITRQLCHGKAQCKSEVKVKGSPTEQDCKNMLQATDAMLAPLAPMGVRKPASCQTK
ncbi:MAG: hypothetical protein KC502_19290, partial [Myxococcales bacterium]|nr:hypothetical protein [Myxococcales bacterium]